MRTRTKKIVKRGLLLFFLVCIAKSRVYVPSDDSELDINNQFGDSLSDNLLMHTMRPSFNSHRHRVPSLQNKMLDRDDMENEGRRLLDEYDDVLEEMEAQDSDKPEKSKAASVSGSKSKDAKEKRELDKVDKSPRKQSKGKSSPVERNLLQVMQPQMTYLQPMSSPQYVNSQPMMTNQRLVTVAQPQMMTSVVQQQPQLMQTYQPSAVANMTTANMGVGTPDKEQWKQALWAKINNEHGKEGELQATRKQRKLNHNGHTRTHSRGNKSKLHGKRRNRSTKGVSKRDILGRVRKNRKARKNQVKQENLSRMRRKIQNMKIGQISSKKGKHNRELWWWKKKKKRRSSRRRNSRSRNSRHHNSRHRNSRHHQQHRHRRRRQDKNLIKLRKYKKQMKKEKAARKARMKKRKMMKNNKLMQKNLVKRLAKNALTMESRKKFDSKRAKMVRGSAKRWNRTYVYNTILMTEKLLYKVHRKKIKIRIANARKAESKAVEDIESFYEDRFLDPDAELDPNRVEQFHIFGA